MYRHANRFVALITLFSFSFSQLFPLSAFANYSFELLQEDALKNRYVVSVKPLNKDTKANPSEIHLTYTYGKLSAPKSAPEELKIRSHMGQSEVTYAHEDLYISFLIDRSGNMTLKKLQADQDAEVLLEGLGDILLEKTELRNIKSLALKGTNIKNQSCVEVDALSLWARGKITNERKLKIKDSIDVFLGDFENNSEILGTGRHLTLNMHDNVLKTKLIHTTHKLTIADAQVENETTIKATQNITFQKCTITNKDGAELNANEIDLERSTLANQSVVKAADLTLKDSTLVNTAKTGTLALLNLISKNSTFANQAGATLQSLAIDLLENSSWTNTSVINTALFNLNGSSFENAGTEASLIVENNMPHKNGTITNNGVLVNKDGARMQAEACVNHGAVNFLGGRLVLQKLLNESTGTLKFSENPCLLTDTLVAEMNAVVACEFANRGITEAMEDLIYDLKVLPGKLNAQKNLSFTPRYQQDHSMQARQILESLDVLGKLKIYFSQFDLVEDLDLPKINDLNMILANPLQLTKTLSTINTEITAPRMHIVGQLKNVGNDQYERIGGAIKSSGRQALHYDDYIGEYDFLESQALWLDGKNSHTTSGLSIGHQLLVVDTPHVSITQHQASWTTGAVSTFEKTNKRGKKEKTTTNRILAQVRSLPLHVSGFWYGGMITNHFNPMVSDIFTDRLSEGESKGQMLSLRGGLFKAGVGGIALTFVQHESLANIDAYSEPYQINCQVYSESGVVARHVIVPTTIDAVGPVYLHGDRQSWQSTQIKTESEDLSVIAQSHLNFPGLKMKQEHVPYLKQGKHGSLYKIVGSHEDGLSANFTSRGKAEIKCESGNVTGVRPTLNAQELDVSPQITQLAPQPLYHHEDSSCVWKVPSKERRVWASVTRIVTGLVASYFTGGLALGWATPLVQGTVCGLSSHTSHSIVMHKGHMRDIRKDLLSEGSVRQLITSIVLSAGTAGVKTDIKSVGGFVKSIAKNMCGGAINGGLSAVIQRQSVSQGMLTGAKSAVITTTFKGIAQKIGQAANPTRTTSGIKPAQINHPTQIILHGVSGTAQGALLSNGHREGIISGAGGSMVGEFIAPLCPWDKQTNASVAKAFTAIIAASTNQNVDIAHTTSSNALDNNYIETGYRSLDDIQIVNDPEELRAQALAIAKAFKQDPTVTPIEDTYYRQGTHFLEDSIKSCYDARTQELTPENVLKVITSYGLDWITLPYTIYDYLSGGMLSKGFQCLDSIPNGIRNVTTNTVRQATENNRLAQNVGDYAYLGSSVFGASKVTTTIRSILWSQRSLQALDLAISIRNPNSPQNIAAYERYKIELKEEAQKSYGGVTTPRVAEKKAFPDRELPRYKGGEPMPDSPLPHCQLGKRKSSKGEYPQVREFSFNGEPIKDIDFTDHGRPFDHPYIHQHRYKTNDTGGTLQRDDRAEMLTIDNLEFWKK